MEFPKDRMKYSSLYGGKKAGKGWLILSLKGFDIEGVNDLALDVEVLEAILQKGEDQTETAKRARELLGG